MPTNQQRREAAKRKLERQLARRAERARRRRIVGVIVTVVAVVAAVGLVYWLANLGDGDNTAAATTSTTPSTPPAKTTEGPCKYTETPQEPAAKDTGGMPPDPAETPKTGTVKVNLKTNQGDIPLIMDRAKAPCTVQAIEFLVKAKYFDATTCHRLTTTEGLKVLQCGDPKGAGNGGPGFTLPDEKPTDLKAGKPGADGQATVIYPRGILAMANTGAPHSGGSQFFMVYGETTLKADYTAFGTIDAAGLAVLDKVAAGGVAGEGSQDGKPKLEVNIETATIAG